MNDPRPPEFQEVPESDKAEPMDPASRSPSIEERIEKLEILLNALDKRLEEVERRERQP